MTWLSPFGFLWLFSVPLLVWLWRLAAQRRLIKVSSLAPFEHLLSRAPRRRLHVVTGALFWLQLAALVLLALALARPALVSAHTRTVLVIVDTSASLAAKEGGHRAFDRLKERLRERAGRRRAPDRWFVITTAPVAVVTPEPTHDPAAIARAIDGLTVSDLPGDLSTAAHIGRGLLAQSPSETIVLTDEAAPPAPHRGDVTWISVGQPLPNIAIIGFDAERELCGEAQTHLAVSLQNFSQEAATVRVRAEQQGRHLAQQEMTLEPQAVGRASLALPEGTAGWVDIVAESPRDALEVDNRVRLMLQGASTVPIAIETQDRQFRRTIGRWLGACEGLQVLADRDAAPISPHVTVMDEEPGHATARGSADPIGIVRFARAASDAVPPVLAHWLIQDDHPVGAYLPTVESVVSLIHPEATGSEVGEPVIWALLEGRRIPIVLAGELDGRRIVTIKASPSPGPEGTPLLVVFFNSLRWVMGRMGMTRTGEPLLLSSFDAGPVVIERPDRSVEQVQHVGGPLRYEATTQAGYYRIRQGRHEEVRAVNFVDPAESNLLVRPSTWRPPGAETGSERPSPSRATRPFAHVLIGLALALLLVEWWLYHAKRRSAV